MPRATGDRAAIELARESYANVQARLAQPGSYATAPYPLPPGTKSHGVAMIFSLAFHELGLLLNDADDSDGGLARWPTISSITLCGRKSSCCSNTFTWTTRLIDSPQGRAIVPGHAIESMWFLMHIFSTGSTTSASARP